MTYLDITAASAVVIGGTAHFLLARKIFRMSFSDTAYQLTLIFGGIVAAIFMIVAVVICYLVLMGIYEGMERDKLVPLRPQVHDDYTFLNWFVFAPFAYFAVWIAGGVSARARVREDVPNTTVEADARKSDARGSP